MKKTIIKIFSVLYIPIFLIGGLLFGLSMLLKIFAAYVMISPELARDEIRHIKKSLNL